MNKYVLYEEENQEVYEYYLSVEELEQFDRNKDEDDEYYFYFDRPYYDNSL